ncbi:hypothetical protein [Rothia aeria]|uniref:hypothetical protein n=1 Tax=Rothia aeria TaxID=172042 RepID=UPI002447EA6A|nr:hypothetical protein [Rothia aeria]
MTESQEGTNKPYAEEEAYLYETYVTEDGIEVPPPTKMMGPRRLARYREEAAEYIRAMGRGKLPEPVDHMGPVVNNLVVDPRVLSIQRRFAALAAQGAIDMSANDEDKLNEPEPLTSSLNAIKPNQQQQKSTSKDPSDLSALNIPLTSSFTAPAPETSSLPMHDYLVRDEPKVESDADAGTASGAAQKEKAKIGSAVGASKRQAPLNPNNPWDTVKSSNPGAGTAILVPDLEERGISLTSISSASKSAKSAAASGTRKTSSSAVSSAASVAADTEAALAAISEAGGTGLTAADVTGDGRKSSASNTAEAVSTADKPSMTVGQSSFVQAKQPDINITKSEPSAPAASATADVQQAKPTKLPAPVSAVDAQGLDLSVLDKKKGTAAEKPTAPDASYTQQAAESQTPESASASLPYADSTADDPTVALDPDKVGELVRRIVEHNQDPEEQPEPTFNSFAKSGYSTANNMAQDSVDYEDEYEDDLDVPRKRSPLSLILLVLCIAVILIGLFIVLSQK